MANVYVVEIHGVENKTEKAMRVSIDDKNFWIPKSVGRVQVLKSKKTRMVKAYRLILPFWYKGELIAEAHNGQYIYNVTVMREEELVQ